MAAKILMPGHGGTTTITVPVGTAAADTLDCSRCQAGMVIVIANANSAAGTFAINEAFGPSGVAIARAATQAVTDATRILYDVTDGPFGNFSFSGANVTTAAITVTVTGFALN